MGHVDGKDDGIGYGVHGDSHDGEGVYGSSFSGVGVYAMSSYGYGVFGSCYNGNGVHGESYDGEAVSGYSYNSNGVHGNSQNGDGVFGNSDRGYGVNGLSYSGDGVNGRSYSGAGVYGMSYSGDGIYGRSNSGYGIYGRSNSGYGIYGRSHTSYAAYLDGKVYIRGLLEKQGGSFKIDHPLDPANKYLCHSFVESPDMKNIYDGVIVLDNNGEAEINLPDWFTALNMDYRYQLTAIGAPGPNLYIAKEIPESGADYANPADNINNNRSSFRIAGGTSGMKVSWQVTGIRKDPWANAHRVQIEEDKPAKERGHYIYPELYGQSADSGISGLHLPEGIKVPLMAKNK
jgi:hypothetical protein